MMPKGFITRLQEVEGIDPIVLESLLKAVGDDPETVFRTVMAQALLPKSLLCEMWASSLGFAYVNPILTVLQCERSEVFPEEIALKAQALCLYQIDGVFSVAMADPTDSKLVKSLERILGGPISLLFSLPEEIEGAIKLYYGAASGYQNSLEDALKTTWAGGEKVILRSLGTNSAKSVPPLGEMMMAKSTLEGVKRVITSPNGIFMVTGPTGSGKTTTLYSAIDFINQPDLNISTIEDPVEYQLDGVNHFQVNHKIGLSFAKIMRSMLRQDPDVILVGEIRDSETAKIATEAALTGHMVLTTLHTNNSLQAVIRLVEMGVETYLVAPSIMGVMAQRLLRRVCPACKESYQSSANLLHQYFNDDVLPEVSFNRGKGCARCKDTGYQGRVGVFEMIEITETIRSLIAGGASYIDILRAAADAGFRGMRYDALQKVLLGLTTLEEVERGTVPEFELNSIV